MIERHTATPENLALTRAAAPSYYRPILQAMREGIALAVALPGTEAYEILFDRPTIVILCDDAPDNTARRGPAQFEGTSLRRVIKTCRAGLVTSCEPLEEAYLGIATTAVLLRRHVLIVETTPRHEADWVGAVQGANPSMGLIIATTRPAGCA